MKPIQDHKFLIDENVDVRVKPIFQEFDVEAQTVKDIEFLEIKDPEISNLIKTRDLVLATHDKGFQYRWKDQELKILWLRIHPTMLEYIQPLLTKFLKTSSRLLPDSFMIELTNDGIMYHQ